MTTENIDARVPIKLTSDPSGHILYSISWLDMVREIVGVSGGDRTTENSSAVELSGNSGLLDELFENPEELEDSEKT